MQRQRWPSRAVEPRRLRRRPWRPAPSGERLDQHLRRADEARRAVAALEGERIEEGGLHRRRHAVLRVALDGADRGAVEGLGGIDAGVGRLGRAVGLVADDDAGAALADAAAELGAGEVEVFAEVVVHRQAVGDRVRPDRLAVHRHRYGDRLHQSAALIMSEVTGRVAKRLPVASLIALRTAAATGHMTSSAIPFGTSVGPSGGRMSVV